MIPLAEQKTLSEQLGWSLLKALHYLMNAVKIHQDNNRLIKDSVSQLINIVRELSCHGDITIMIWRGRFHVQGEKLLYRRENYHVVNEMAEVFSQRELGGLGLAATFPDASPEDIVAFIRLLNESGLHEGPFEWLEQQRAMKEFAWVEVYPQQEESNQSVDLQRREKAQQTYHQALSIVKEVAEKASKGIAGVRKARRLAQIMVDLVQEDRSLMMGLSTIKDYDDYTYNHSVNVALLATCLGRQVGLSHVFLEHITVCGLFHDLGKVGVSKDILLKPGQLSSDEWDQMQRHPLIGVRKILGLQAPHSLKSRIILGPFEHHLNPDLSGYPRTHFMKKLSLIGRILRIADVYEALTSERNYRPRAFSPDEAMRRMWSERGKNFDPLLLKCFINMMGIYPIGTLVELNTGETGLVMGYSDEVEKTLPLVMVLVEQDSGKLARGEMINLAVQADNEGMSQKNIVKGVPISRFGIQPSQFFLQAEEDYEGNSPRMSA